MRVKITVTDIDTGEMLGIADFDDVSITVGQGVEHDVDKEKAANEGKPEKERWSYYKLDGQRKMNIQAWTGCASFADTAVAGHRK